jgi:tRNA pseudouridine55 synthase
MDGIIILNKPTGITSAKALYRVRKITRVRKSGHAGTLDPAAAGVLLLCLGKATKLVEQLMDLPKVYRATARLDVTSESFDSDRALVEVPISTMPDQAGLCAA